MKLPDYQTISTGNSTAILPGVAESDTAAVKSCVDIYGNLIWALARKYTGSIEEAEAATEEIFLDLWRRATRFDPKKFDEIAFIFLVARRRLKRRLLQAIGNF
jgi:RNA polymerase sigma-70 factor (ECF subfamily)